MANQNVYTASYLLASAKRRGQIPEASDRSFSRDDLLALMSEECQTYMTALLMSVREEWFVRTEDQDITTSTTYRIPVRSIGSKLSQVLVGDSGSNNWSLLRRIEPIDQWNSNYGASWSPGAVQGYFLQNTDLRLLANPPTGSTLRMLYFLRPNRIVDVSACGTITAIDTGAKQVTIDADTIPSGSGEFTTSNTFDLIRGTPGFETLAMDQTITAISGADNNVFTYSESLPDGLAVGDFMCFAGEAPVAQLPVEMQPLLTQRLVVKVLEALGDPKVAVAKTMLEEQRKSAVDVLTSNRTENDARYIVGRNGPGWGRKYWGW